MVVQYNLFLSKLRNSSCVAGRGYRGGWRVKNNDGWLVFSYCFLFLAVGMGKREDKKREKLVFPIGLTFPCPCPPTYWRLWKWEREELGYMIVFLVPQ